MNGEIRCKEVRLVDLDGEPIGVVPIEEALDRALKAGVDLVEIAATANPPDTADAHGPAVNRRCCRAVCRGPAGMC